jgi:UPF0755 protein
MQTFFSQFLKLAKKKKRYTIVFGIFVFFLIVYSIFFKPPGNFPLGQVVTIDPGQSLQSITDTLYKNHIISSPLVFRSISILLGGETKMIAGDYLLPVRQGPLAMAYRFIQGRFGLNISKITIPEGWNISQIGDYLEENLVDFDKEEFLSLAKGKEGYLFPDTYFVFGSAKPDHIIDMMQANFGHKIKTIEQQIFDSGYSEEEIIIMASIVEEEAMTQETRKVVAGILWKRLGMGMPLQVDSTFSYVNGKNTYELTLDDLKIDSKYNTYVYKGLPPGPISNPGLAAIEATLHPTETKYLYFLTGKDGKMHYAATFEQHKVNKAKYL